MKTTYSLLKILIVLKARLRNSLGLQTYLPVNVYKEVLTHKQEMHILVIRAGGPLVQWTRVAIQQFWENKSVERHLAAIGVGETVLKVCNI